MLCLDKICEQKEFFKDLMADNKPFFEACKKPYLQIECKGEKKCFFPTKKKKHFQKHFHKKSSSKKPFRISRKKMFLSVEKRSITVVSSARNTITLLENVLIYRPKLFVSYNISNILHCYLKTKMLDPTSQNSQNKMIRLLSSSQNPPIMMIFQSFLQFKMLIRFQPCPNLLSKCLSFLQSSINMFLSSGLLTLV